MEALKDIGGKIAVGIGVLIIVAFWAWPREGWVNEWHNGDCLAWRVTSYADGLIQQADGPYIVSDKWC